MHQVTIQVSCTKCIPATWPKTVLALLHSTEVVHWPLLVGLPEPLEPPALPGSTAELVADLLAEWQLWRVPHETVLKVVVVTSRQR